MRHVFRWALFLGAAATCVLSASVAADEDPLGASVMVAPTIGQSDAAGVRYELGGDAHLDRFAFELDLGLSHMFARRPSAEPSMFADPNCVDPIVQACVGNAADPHVPGRVLIADTSVGFGAMVMSSPVFLITPRLDLVLPTSKYSRQRTLILGAHLGADLDVSVAKRVSIKVLARLRKDFHSQAVPAIYIFPAENEPAVPTSFGFRAAGSRLPGREETSLGGVNTSHGVHLGLDARMRVVAGLFADLGYGWTHVWAYLNPLFFELRRGQANMQTGTFGVGWSQPVGPVELEARLGAATTGFTRTSDNQSAAFPWWNLDPNTRDEDYSVVDLRLTATY